MDYKKVKAKAENWDNFMIILKFAGVLAVLISVIFLLIWVYGVLNRINDNNYEVRRLWKHKAGGNQVQELHDRLEKLERKVNEKHLYDPPEPNPQPEAE